MPCAIISIPFAFWYLAVIVGQDTFPTKLTTIGVVSAVHIVICVIAHFAKKDFL